MGGEKCPPFPPSSSLFLAPAQVYTYTPWISGGIRCANKSQVQISAFPLLSVWPWMCHFPWRPLVSYTVREVGLQTDYVVLRHGLLPLPAGIQTLITAWTCARGRGLGSLFASPGCLLLTPAGWAEDGSSKGSHPDKLYPFYTYVRGFSRRLPEDPTISPRVQKAWPRKSCIARAEETSVSHRVHSHPTSLTTCSPGYMLFE